MQNVRNEWMKLIRKRSTMVFLILSALFPLLIGLAMNILQNRLHFTAFDGESFPLMILSLAVTIYLPLLLALTVSDTFPGEQEKKALSFILVRPISRFKLFTSKILCTAIYLLTLLVILCISSIVTGAIWLENFTVHGLVMGVSAYILSWFPLMALSLLLVFFVQWLGSSSRAITFSIILYLIMVVLTFLFPVIAAWLPTYDSNWYQRWMNNGISGVVMGRTVYLLSWCSLFFTLGYYKFTRKEF
jgi:ABC-2 type transport system permease protein